MGHLVMPDEIWIKWYNYSEAKLIQVLIKSSILWVGKFRSTGLKTKKFHS